MKTYLPFRSRVIAVGLLVSSMCTMPALAAAPSSNNTPAGAYSITELDTAPRPISQARPTYPAEHRAAKTSGKAMISLVVDEAGATTEVRCVDATDPAFAREAIAAVSQWKFSPAVKDGRNVRCRLEVPIVFSLKRS